MVGLIPLFAVEIARRRRARPAARLQEARCDWFLENRPDLARHIAYRESDGRRHGAPPARASRRASASSACCATCSTRTSSSRRTASARCRASTATSPYVLQRRRQRVPRRLRARASRHRPVRRQLELARAGLVPGQLPADRGARALPPLLRRRAARSSARPARARCMNLGEVAARARRAGSRALFLPDADGRRPCHGGDRALRRATRTGATSCCSTSTSTATTGRGLGASHQTGWTALVARCLEDVTKT